MFTTALGLWIGLAMANFLWQLIYQKEWMVAIEISLFQAVALGMFLLIAPKN